LKIAFVINTPAQLHFYGTIINQLKTRGHSVGILLRDYRETTFLADRMGLAYVKYSDSSRSKMEKALTTPLSMLSTFRFLRSFRSDFVVGSGIVEMLPSALLGVPRIMFSDGEPQTSASTDLQLKLSIPFANAIITPESYLQDIGKKQVRMPSFKELSYLHPNNFKPRSDILDTLGLEKGTPFILLRFNAFDSLHDVGIDGIELEEKMEMIARLERYAKVMISTESPLPEKLRGYELITPKDRIHDVLFYASLLLTETGTMTTESAILGTPAIMIHPKADLFGNFVELREEYGLIFTYKEVEPAVEKAVELIQRPNLKKEWLEKRDSLLAHKVDATPFMLNLIETFPASIR
jgi:uncharacterized protein